ncbi:hypothetical protein GCM10010517_25960 [Streptosporangium fragile]|uniref:NlpC/P60 domain-containing protein n=1 Tax=Streptosporangium fragile TaxID=46186 RepID=A0ABP6IDZ6_9ACTN
MITAFLTVTVLSATLAGGSQVPAPRPSPEACDAWTRLLSVVGLPVDTPRRSPEARSSPWPPERDAPGWPPEWFRAVLTTVCETFSDEKGPERPVIPRRPDGRRPDGSSVGPDGSPAGSDGSPARIHQPEPILPAPPGHSVSTAKPGPPTAESELGDPARASSRPAFRKSAPGTRARRPPHGKAVSTRGASSRPRQGRRARAALTRGQVAAAVALRQVGTPYVWGGGSSEGPTGGGFDCSGLALHAWARAGARLPHYTGSQFKQGRRVPFSRLRPGDLVFFGGGTGDPTHVGVYVGAGVMVHAPKTGDVVKTTDFASSPYYRSRYRGAVRPVPH